MPRISMEVLGFGKLRAALQAKAEQYGKGMERGLAMAGLRLQRESQKEVPRLTSNLAGSAFTRREPGTSGLQTVVLVGYTAEYAIYVHENLDAVHGEEFNTKYAEQIAKHEGKNHPYWRDRGPGQKAKFLSDPYRRLKSELVDTVLKYLQT